MLCYTNLSVIMGDGWNNTAAWSNNQGAPMNNMSGGWSTEAPNQGQMFHQQSQHSQYFPPQRQQQNYGGYANQHSGCGPRGDGLGLNPNAPAFVPRQTHASASNSSQNSRQMDMYPPAYAVAPMYGAGREQPQPVYEQNYVHAAPPAMTSFYSDNEADLAAYEAMYNQFGNSAHAQQYIPSVDLQYKMADSENSQQLQEIQVGLEQLMDNNEEFESWAGAIRERVAAKNMTDASRQTAVQILVEMAIAVSPGPRCTASPQYLFARLLAYLSVEVPDLLRNNVLAVLEIYHSVREQYELERKCNLIVFFAELYTRLEITNGTRINTLGDAVIQQAGDILKCQPTDASMKQLINVMKMAGPDLDSTDPGYQKMSELLTRLSGFGRGHPQLSESIKTQINMMIEKRQKGWSESRGAPSCPSVPSGAIIGADGREIELNDEERKFLESHFGRLDGEAAPDTDSSIDETDVLKEMGNFEQEERLKKDASEATAMLENLSVSMAEKLVDGSDEPSEPKSSS